MKSEVVREHLGKVESRMTHELRAREMVPIPSGITFCGFVAGELGLE